MASELAQKIYDNLMTELYTGDLQPGDLINRRQIAARYQVSVTPVLEALTRLEIEGFLETLPRRGTRIKPITALSLCDSFILRDAVEVKAARLYYGKLAGSVFAELSREAELVDRAAASNFEDWKVEIAFHQKLVTLASAPVLQQAFTTNMHLHLFYGMQKIIPLTKQVPRDNHYRLVHALADCSNADEAGSAMRRHVWYGKEYILEAAGLRLEEL